jgi:hypothetical protein
MAGGDQGAGEQGQQDSCARHPAALLLPAPQHPSKLGTPLAFRPLHSAPSAFATVASKAHAGAQGEAVADGGRRPRGASISTRRVKGST